MEPISKSAEWNICLNLLLEDDVSEIEANGPNDFFYKKRGKRLKLEGVQADSAKAYTEGIKVGLVPHIQSPWPFVENSYLFEGPLRYHADGKYIRGRCHIVLPPACDYPQVTIAKKSTVLPDLDSIAARGSMSTEMLYFMKQAVNCDLTMAISGGTGAGKALTLDTKIPTPSGFTTMGELKVGDEIFDHHGNVGRVTHKFPQPARQVYKVTFSTGEEIYCDAEHNWWVSTTDRRRELVYKANTRARYGDERLNKSIVSPEKMKMILEIIENTPDGVMVPIGNVRNLVSQQASEKAAEALAPLTLTRKEARYHYVDLKQALIWIVNNWAIKKMSERKPAPLYTVKTTKELLAEGLRENNSWKFHVPTLEKALSYERNVDKNIGLEPNELPIHPYLFGLWLGDGTSDRGEITGVEEDLVEYQNTLNALGAKQNIKLTGKKYNAVITGVEFRAALRELNIMKTKPGHSKKVPQMYEFASEKSRRLLIAGMIDSDGWVDKNSWGFGNTNRDLIESFYRIANSLGYNPTISKARFQKFTDTKGFKKTGKASWSVSFLTNDSVALLPRKINKHKNYAKEHNKTMKRNVTRKIVAIETVSNRVEEMACITVDTPDSTYLAGESYTTTHNTTMLEAITKLFRHDIRIGVAEDAPELYLEQPNVSYLHSVPWQPGMNPNDVATLSWVVQQYQRMRTDKIIIGETRGAEFSDFLIAANSGMDGSLTTIHANDPVQCLDKMTNFALKASNSPIRTINTDIANSIDIIIQLMILPDGRHRMGQIQEITRTLGNDDAAKITTNPLYAYNVRNDTFVKVSPMTDELRKKFEKKAINIEPFLNSPIGVEASPHHSKEQLEAFMGDKEAQQQNRGLPSLPNQGLPRSI